MFLYEELLNLDNPEHIDLAFRVASILLRLPLLRTEGLLLFYKY